MKKYDATKITSDFTNLDYAKQFFPKAKYSEKNDTYDLGNMYEIEWSGDGELFYVTHTTFDWGVGYVTSDDLFSGNFGECIEFVKEDSGFNIQDDESEF